MTKKIKTYKVDSYSEVISSLDSIVKDFLDIGILKIVGHAFSKEDHIDLAKKMGDIFNWNIHSEASEGSIRAAYHKDGQSIDPDKEYNQSSEEYVLDWHIEQVYTVHPPLAGFWFMDSITSPEGSGMTHFIDSNEIYETLKVADKDLLDNAVVIWNKPANGYEGPFYTKAVERHPFNSLPIVRVETDAGCTMSPTLYSVNDRKPTAEEEARFQKIVKALKNQMYDDLSIRYTQEWRNGDMILVDLFRMYHAVMGGFKYNERLISMVVANNRVIKNSSHNIRPELKN